MRNVQHTRYRIAMSRSAFSAITVSDVSVRRQAALSIVTPSEEDARDDG
jgi:hypothetical protein